MIPKRPKPRRVKPMTCVACDFNLAALKDEQNLLALERAITKEYAEGLAQWKRIWSTDSRHWSDTIKKQADVIAALVEGNKALRAELDRYERFHVLSPALQKGQ